MCFLINISFLAILLFLDLLSFSNLEIWAPNSFGLYIKHTRACIIISIQILYFLARCCASPYKSVSARSLEASPWLTRPWGLPNITPVQNRFSTFRVNSSQTTPYRLLLLLQPPLATSSVHDSGDPAFALYGYGGQVENGGRFPGPSS